MFQEFALRQYLDDSAAFCHPPSNLCCLGLKEGPRQLE